MPRYRDADALMADIERTIENSGCVNHEGEIMDCVRYAPEVGVVPAVRGEWKTNSNYPDKLICSVCGYKEDMWWADNGTHYCPNCGAKMEVEHETD